VFKNVSIMKKSNQKLRVISIELSKQEKHWNSSFTIKKILQNYLENDKWQILDGNTLQKWPHNEGDWIVWLSDSLYHTLAKSLWTTCQEPCLVNSWDVYVTMFKWGEKI